MKAGKLCPDCSSDNWEYLASNNESFCIDCGSVLPGIDIFQSEEGTVLGDDEGEPENDFIRLKRDEEEARKKIDSARNPRLIPAPEDGAQSRLLERLRSEKEGGEQESEEGEKSCDEGNENASDHDGYNEQLFSRARLVQDEGWIPGEHEMSSGSSGEILNAAETEANRQAASFLGLGGTEGGRTDAILPAEKVCPPFERPSGPLRNLGLIRDGLVGGRLQIDHAITSVFMSMFSGKVGRSRPPRMAEDGWGSNQADWVLWELYSQLSLRMGKPWFLGRWARTVGLNTDKLHDIMPCSGECLLEMQKGSIDSRLGPRAMAELLWEFEGISIPDSVSDDAEQILNNLGERIGELGGLSLHSRGRPVQFHHGIYLLSNRNWNPDSIKHESYGEFDGSEWWDESEHQEFEMWHISVALCLLQAMYEERLDFHQDGDYQKVLGFLKYEVDRYTGSTWGNLKSSWDEIFTEATGKDPFREK